MPDVHYGHRMILTLCIEVAMRKGGDSGSTKTEAKKKNKPLTKAQEELVLEYLKKTDSKGGHIFSRLRLHIKEDHHYSDFDCQQDLESLVWALQGDLTTFSSECPDEQVLSTFIMGINNIPDGTLLHIAAAAGKYEIAKYFFNEGADREQKNKAGKRAFELISSDGNKASELHTLLDTQKSIFKNGDDDFTVKPTKPEAKKKNKQVTPSQEKLVLDYLNKTDSEGGRIFSQLRLHIKEDHHSDSDCQQDFDKLTWALQRDLKTFPGESPDKLVVECPDEQVLSTFIMRIGNTADESLLHIAVKAERCELVEYLLNKGANPEQERRDRKTPFDLISSDGNKASELGTLLDTRKSIFKNGDDASTVKPTKPKAKKPEVKKTKAKKKNKQLTGHQENLVLDYLEMPLKWGPMSSMGNVAAITWMRKSSSMERNDYKVIFEGIVSALYSVVNKQELYTFIMSLKDSDDKTLLHTAAEKGNYEIAKYFLDMGADPNQMNKDDKTPLGLVSPHGNKASELRALLITRMARTMDTQKNIPKGDDDSIGKSTNPKAKKPEAKKKNKQVTPSQEKLVLVYLSKTLPEGGDVFSRLRFRIKGDYYSDTSCQESFKKIILALQDDLTIFPDERPDKQTLYTLLLGIDDTYDGTLLHIAAKAGRYYLVEYFLNKGADPKQKNADDKMPLELVIQDSNNRELHGLLATRMATQKTGALKSIIKDEHEDSIIKSTNPKAKKPEAKKKNKPLTKPQEKLVLDYLKKTDSEAGRIFFRLRLHIKEDHHSDSDCQQDLKSLIWLLRRDLKTFSRRDLRTFSGESHDKPVGESLDEQALSTFIMSLKDSDDKTLLHIAAEAGRYYLVEHFLNKGADLEQTNTDGKTPFDLISSDGNKASELRALLIPLKNVIKAGKISAFQKYREQNENWHEEAILDENSFHHPLHYAAACLKDGAFFKTFLEAYCNAKNQSVEDAVMTLDLGETLLAIAAFNGRTEIVRHILSINSAYVNKQNNDGWTALHYAADASALVVMQLLIKHGASLAIRTYKTVKSSSSRVNKQRNKLPHEITPMQGGKENPLAEMFLTFIEAIVNGNVVELRSLMKESPTWLDIPLNNLGNKGYTAVPLLISYGSFHFFMTAFNGLPEKNREQIKKREQIKSRFNRPDHSGTTPLMHAVRYQNKIAMEFLLDHGADIDGLSKRESGEGMITAYEQALRKSWQKGIALLEKYKPHEFRLKEAIDNKDTDALKQCFDPKKIPNASLYNTRNAKSMTHVFRKNRLFRVIHYVAAHSNKDFFEKFLEVYCEKTKQTPQRALRTAENSEDKRSVLHTAAAYNKHDIVAYMLSRGWIDVNVRDNDGWTPLHHVAFHGVLSAAVLLVDHGASLTAETYQGDAEGVTDGSIVKQYRGKRPGEITSSTSSTYSNPITAWKETFLRAIADGDVDTIKRYMKQNSTWLEIPLNPDGYTAIQVAISTGTLGAFTKAFDAWQVEVAAKTKTSPKGERERINVAAGLISRKVPCKEVKLTNSVKALAPFYNQKNAVKFWITSFDHIENTDWDWSELSWLLNHTEKPRILGDLLSTVVLGSDHPGLIKRLLDEFENLDASTISNAKNHALRLAVVAGKIPMVQVLFDLDANINQTDKDGKTLLHLAAMANQFLMVGGLIKLGVKVDQTDEAGNTALHLAVKANKILMASILIDQGANVDQTDQAGNTLLHLVVMANKFPMARELVKLGADTNQTDDDGNTLLHIAADKGYSDTVRFCLDKENGLGLSLLEKNDKGQRPDQFKPQNRITNRIRLIFEELLIGDNPKLRDQMFAVSHEWLDIPLEFAPFKDYSMELVSMRGAIDFSSSLGFGDMGVRSCPGKKAYFIHKVLMMPNATDRMLILKHLERLLSKEELKKEADRLCGDPYPTVNNEDEFTPLMLAMKVEKCSEEEILKSMQWLLDRGAEVDGVTKTRQLTCLQEALLQDEPEIVKLLINNEGKKPDINKQYLSGETPLRLAMKSNYEKVIDVLIQNGADLSTAYEKTRLVDVKNKHFKKEYFNKFVKAVKGVDIKTLNTMFKQNNTWLKCPDEDGKVALHFAVEKDSAKSVEWILDKEGHCDIDARDKNGDTALHVAVAKGSVKSVELILAEEGRFNINAQNEKGDTALHLAVRSGNDAIYNLLEDKADFSIKNNAGVRPQNVREEYVYGLYKTEKNVVTRTREQEAKAKKQEEAKAKKASKQAIKSIRKFITKDDSDGLFARMQQDPKNFTLDRILREAAIQGKYEIFQVFEKQADLDSSQKGAKKQINARSNSDGGTFLHHMVEKGKVKEVNWLLANGAKNTFHNNDELTPLHLAAKLGNAEMVKLLVESTKAEAKIDRLSGFCTLEAETETVMISYSVSELITEVKGTPLHFAAYEGNREAVDMLLTSGASLTIPGFFWKDCGDGFRTNYEFCAYEIQNQGYPIFKQNKNVLREKIANLNQLISDLSFTRAALRELIEKPSTLGVSQEQIAILNEVKTDLDEFLFTDMELDETSFFSLSLIIARGTSGFNFRGDKFGFNKDTLKHEVTNPEFLYLLQHLSSDDINGFLEKEEKLTTRLAKVFEAKLKPHYEKFNTSLNPRITKLQEELVFLKKRKHGESDALYRKLGDQLGLTRTAQKHLLPGDEGAIFRLPIPLDGSDKIASRSLMLTNGPYKVDYKKLTVKKCLEIISKLEAIEKSLLGLEAEFQTVAESFLIERAKEYVSLAETITVLDGLNGSVSRESISAADKWKWKGDNNRKPQFANRLKTLNKAVDFLKSEFNVESDKAKAKPNSTEIHDNLEPVETKKRQMGKTTHDTEETEEEEASGASLKTIYNLEYIHNNLEQVKTNLSGIVEELQEIKKKHDTKEGKANRKIIEKFAKIIKKNSIIETIKFRKQHLTLCTLERTLAMTAYYGIYDKFKYFGDLQLKEKGGQEIVASYINFQRLDLLDNSTFLHRAAARHSTTVGSYVAEQVVKWLLANGAKNNIYNAEGVTPLHYAAASERAEKIVEMLLDEKVKAETDVDVQSTWEWKMEKEGGVNQKYGRQALLGKGATPLHFAARMGHAKVVNILLAHKANPKIKADYWRQNFSRSLYQSTQVLAHQLDTPSHFRKENPLKVKVRFVSRLVNRINSDLQELDHLNNLPKAFKEGEKELKNAHTELKKLVHEMKLVGEEEEEEEKSAYSFDDVVTTPKLTDLLRLPVDELKRFDDRSKEAHSDLSRVKKVVLRGSYRKCTKLFKRMNKLGKSLAKFDEYRFYSFGEDKLFLLFKPEDIVSFKPLVADYETQITAKRASLRLIPSTTKKKSYEQKRREEMEPFTIRITEEFVSELTIHECAAIVTDLEVVATSFPELEASYKKECKTLFEKQRIAHKALETKIAEFRKLESATSQLVKEGGQEKPRYVESLEIFILGLNTKINSKAEINSKTEEEEELKEAFKDLEKLIEIQRYLNRVEKDLPLAIRRLKAAQNKELTQLQSLIEIKQTEINIRLAEVKSWLPRQTADAEKSKAVEADAEKLTAVQAFRDAIGCTVSGVEKVILNSEKLQAITDKKTLRGIISKGALALTGLEAYTKTLKAQSRVKRRNETTNTKIEKDLCNGLRESIQYACLILNGQLKELRKLDAGTAPDRMGQIDVLRDLVGNASGKESISSILLNQEIIKSANSGTLHDIQEKMEDLRLAFISDIEILREKKKTENENADTLQRVLAPALKEFNEALVRASVGQEVLQAAIKEEEEEVVPLIGSIQELRKQIAKDSKTQESGSENSQNLLSANLRLDPEKLKKLSARSNAKPIIEKLKALTETLNTQSAVLEDKKSRQKVAVEKLGEKVARLNSIMDGLEKEDNVNPEIKKSLEELKTKLEKPEEPSSSSRDSR